MRATVVGSGFVGATSAMRIVQKGLAEEVVLIDIIEGLPQGLALDMRESAPIEGFEPNIRGTNDYADTAESDLVVITAGLPRQPGMSRMDLLEKNAGITRDVVRNVKEHSPSAILIVVTNPLDEIAGDAKEVLPVCAWCTGQYGISDVYVGVPARLGKAGVEEIVELDLPQAELRGLRAAAEGIRAKCADLGKLG